MSDLISRRSAIDAMISEFKRVSTTAIRAKDVLEKLTSAEPERKTGKWIYLGDGYKCPWSCSNCSSCSDERTDYCPMCGAKMEGEKDG